MSRPSLPDARRRSRIMSFRVSESDYLRLADKAAKANLRVNAYVRKLALSGKLHIQTTRAADPALIKQLHHIGHNLNQLVKNAHIFGRVSPQIATLCKRIAAIIDSAMEDS